MRSIGVLTLASASLAAASLAGCATGPSRADVLASLVGRPESDALHVFGAPNRLLDFDGHRFLAYEDAGVGYVTGAPYGFGYYAPVSIPVVRSCTMTIEITGGRVASWNLRGNACG